MRVLASPTLQETTPGDPRRSQEVQGMMLPLPGWPCTPVGTCSHGKTSCSHTHGSCMRVPHAGTASGSTPRSTPWSLRRYVQMCREGRQLSASPCIQI